MMFLMECIKFNKIYFMDRWTFKYLIDKLLIFQYTEHTVHIVMNNIIIYYCEIIKE